MGGRGASSGSGGGGGANIIPGGFVYTKVSTKGMIDAVQGNVNGVTPNTNTAQKGDWTDNNNPELLKYQAQDDLDKMGSFLHSTDNMSMTYDPMTGKSQFAGENDPYGYYNFPFQKLVHRLGINKKPMVVSESEFNKIQAQTGAEVFYRGWSGKASADTFLNSDNYHVGNGRYGDGTYFANNTSTASAYGRGAMTKMMLSPNARMIDYDTLVKTMPKSGNIAASLRIAGRSGQRSYGKNIGESQWAIKMGYNVIKVDSRSNPYYVALTRDAFIVSSEVR